MSKSFISILGTNDYLECRHSFKDKISEKPVKYAQEDLIKFFCSDFDENDEIRIFLTKDAKEKNWEDNGHKNNDVSFTPNKGLKTRLNDLRLKCKIIPIDINEGYNEGEIWEIFQTIYNTFQEEEEVIVDVTHSFRSLPMLMIPLLNFAKQVKGIKVGGIYYAAFESLGKIDNIKKLQPQDRITPVLNLTAFSDLQDWTNATYDFIHNANVKNMFQLVKYSVNNNSINSQEKYFLSNVIKNLDSLANNIAMCRGNELLKYDYSRLKKDINSLKDNNNLPPAFIYLIDEIENKIRSFSTDPLQLTLSVVDWCITHSLFQQAITLLQEFSITVVLIQEQLDISDQTNRELVAQSFKIFSQGIQEENWREPAATNKELVYKFLESDLIKNLTSSFSSLNDLRNDVNHAGFLINSRNVSSIKDRLNNVIESYKKFLMKNYPH